MTITRVGRAKLILGDWTQVPREELLEDVAAIVTDPPYGISHPTDYASRGRGIREGYNIRASDWPEVPGDDVPFNPEPILELGLPTVLWGGNHYAHRLPPSGGWLVWDKERPDTMDQATCELAWSNCVKGVRRFRHLWNGMMRASEKGQRFHPMQKPVALAAWTLALPWIPAGGILDPYAGAGWVAVAATIVGRPVVAVELVEDWYWSMVDRVRQAADQPSLGMEQPRQIGVTGG